jgi:hypothetical protein
MDLSEVIKILHIANVYMRGMETVVDEEFDIFSAQEELEVRHQLSPISSSLIEYGNTEQPDQKMRLFRVHLRGELLMVRPMNGDPHQPEPSDIRLRLVAQYASDYRVTKLGEIPQVALDEFALKNAAFHVWPYWREYIQSTLARMQLPPFSLPMYQVPKVRKKESVAEK